MSDLITRLEARLDKLERRNRVLGLIAVAAIAAGSMVGYTNIARASSPTNVERPVVENLRVHRLEVVDPNGVTRVILGAPLPNAKRDGKTISRGGSMDNTASGILLFDYAGRERSGYVTNDKGYSNVFFTLDDAKGAQHALFISEPEGATTLRLFNASPDKMNDRADFQMTDDGPAISLVKDGKPVFKVP